MHKDFQQGVFITANESITCLINSQAWFEDLDLGPDFHSGKINGELRGLMCRLVGLKFALHLPILFPNPNHWAKPGVRTVDGVQVIGQLAPSDHLSEASDHIFKADVLRASSMHPVLHPSKGPFNLG